MQETCKIRWLMYCKSTICKSGQFKHDDIGRQKGLSPWVEHDSTTEGDKVKLERMDLNCTTYYVLPLCRNP